MKGQNENYYYCTCCLQHAHSLKLGEDMRMLGIGFVRLDTK